MKWIMTKTRNFFFLFFLRNLVPMIWTPIPLRFFSFFIVIKKKRRQIVYCTFVIANVRPNFGFFHCVCETKRGVFYKKKNDD